MKRSFGVHQPNFDTPYVRQFSLGIQALLPLNSMSLIGICRTVLAAGSTGCVGLRRDITDPGLC